MLRKSYKLSVALWSCFVSGLVLLLFLVGITFNVKHEMKEIVDRNIETIALALLEGGKLDAIARDPFADIQNLDSQSYQRVLEEEEKGDGQVRDLSVKLLAIKRPDNTFSYKNERFWQDEYSERMARDPSYEIGEFLTEEARSQQRQSSNVFTRARWELRHYSRDGYGVYLAINQYENNDEYLEVLLLGVFALPLTFVAVALGGWWIGVFAVKPIKEISQVVALIEADDLRGRVPNWERGDEIGELARLMNAMLKRIENGYDQAKRFTADASHELRTPLAILQGELEANMRESDVGAASNARMLEEIRRLKTLTHSLLFLSEADVGSLKIDSEELDFSKVVSQTLVDSEEISTDSSLAFDGAEIAQEIKVKGDPSLIQQTVMNLLRNASKFNRTNGRVLCRVFDSDGFARMIVGNTGGGIPAALSEKVFERFYRLDEGRSREQGGFGLGLNIAREIARAHGGDIKLLSSENDWTEFELSLPL